MSAVSSSARAASRSSCPPACRDSIAMFLPSTEPSSRSRSETPQTVQAAANPETKHRSGAPSPPAAPRRRAAQPAPRPTRTGTRVASLDHLVRARQQRRRDGEAERLRRLEVDHQLELRRLLDGRSAGLAPLRILSTRAAPCEKGRRSLCRTTSARLLGPSPCACRTSGGADADFFNRREGPVELITFRSFDFNRNNGYARPRELRPGPISAVARCWRWTDSKERRRERLMARAV